MSDTKQTLIENWSRERAAFLAVVCLTFGILGGWWIRGFQSPDSAAPASPVATQAPAPQPASANLDRTKAMADGQAAPLLARLQSDPANPDLLTSIGNLYYDAQQYPAAIDYYGRALTVRPTDASVRTDMATAYWYLGNADRALAEFDKALNYAPNNPNTLFNRGLVRWRGKKDAAGAIADWQNLLATNPNYAEKDKVQQLLNEAKGAQSAKPGV